MSETDLTCEYIEALAAIARERARLRMLELGPISAHELDSLREKTINWKNVLQVLTDFRAAMMRVRNYQRVVEANAQLRELSKLVDHAGRLLDQAGYVPLSSELTN